MAFEHVSDQQMDAILAAAEDYAVAAKARDEFRKNGDLIRDKSNVRLEFSGTVSIKQYSTPVPTSAATKLLQAELDSTALEVFERLSVKADIEALRAKDALLRGVMRIVAGGE